MRLTWKGLTKDQVLGIENLDAEVGVHMQLFMFRVGMFFSTQEEAFQACAGLARRIVCGFYRLRA